MMAVRNHPGYVHLADVHVRWLQNEMGEGLFGMSDDPDRWVYPLWDYAQDVLLDAWEQSDGGPYPSIVTVLVAVRGMMQAAFAVHA